MSYVVVVIANVYCLAACGTGPSCDVAAAKALIPCLPDAAIDAASVFTPPDAGQRFDATAGTLAIDEGADAVTVLEGGGLPDSSP